MYFNFIDIYKVGVLLSHVHSIVMSSNSMVGHLPVDLQQLTQLRMVELATMTGKYVRYAILLLNLQYFEFFFI